MNKAPATFSGILVLDKPSGITSHDAVGRLRRLLGTRQIGHTGTLDPLATGVLPMLCGRAVKASEYLTAHDKKYEAVFLLGYESQSGDTDTQLVPTGAKIPPCEEVFCAVSEAVGRQMQTPPMTSAIKINGKKLLEYQREGIEIEPPQRSIEIYSAKAVQLSENEYSLSLHVSKGTYVRSVITDIGKKLGCGAVMSSLRRTGSGMFDLSHACTLHALEAMTPEERIDRLIPLEEAFSDIEKLTLEPFFARLCKSGCEIYLKKIKKNYPCGTRLRLYDEDGFFALGEVMEFDGGNAVKMIKLFSL